MDEIKKYIYLDQNIYSNLLNVSNSFGFEIEELSKKLKNYRLLLSIANCYELSRSNERDRVINQLEKCHISYLPLAFHLQDEQLTHYVYKKYFNREYKILSICPHISQIFTFFKPTPPILLGDSLRDFIKIFSKESLLEVRKNQEKTWLESANTLYGNKKMMSSKEINDQVCEIRISKFLKSLRDPDGKPINNQLQNQITDDLKNEIDKHPQKWPAIQMENLFFNFRYGNNGRKSDKNDPRDIEHIICGLTNSDYFITCDTNMLNFCEFAKKFCNLPEFRNNLDFL